MHSKYDETLQAILVKGEEKILPVIVQTVDGLKKEDEQTVKSLGGTIKKNLYIVNAFSADLPAKAIPILALNPRVTKIYYDAKIQAAD
jgi:hypothetical protein